MYLIHPLGKVDGVIWKTNPPSPHRWNPEYKKVELWSEAGFWVTSSAVNVKSLKELKQAKFANPVVSYAKTWCEPYWDC